MAYLGFPAALPCMVGLPFKVVSSQHVSAFFVRWEWYYAGVGFFGRSEVGDWEANLSARISGLRLAYGWTFSSGSGSRATSGLAGIIKFKREDVILPQCGVSTAEDEPGASTGAGSWYSGMPTRSSLNRSGFKQEQGVGSPS